MMTGTAETFMDRIRVLSKIENNLGRWALLWSNKSGRIQHAVFDDADAAMTTALEKRLGPEPFIRQLGIGRAMGVARKQVGGIMHEGGATRT
jgi:hypothetical protein